MARLPTRSTPNGFAVETTSPRRIAWRTEDCGCGVENGYLLDSLGGWAEWKGGRLSGSWVLLVEEKYPDKIVKVDLTNLFPKCRERGTGVLRS